MIRVGCACAIRKSLISHGSTDTEQIKRKIESCTYVDPHGYWTNIPRILRSSTLQSSYAGCMATVENILKALAHYNDFHKDFSEKSL